MTITWSEVLSWVPVLTAAGIPLLAWMLRGIHKLVNDRLDKALTRIDDLEKIVRRSDSMNDPGSTARSLRSSDR